jgi:hypothetical protein
MLKAVLVAGLAPRIAVMADGAAPGSRPGWLDASGQARALRARARARLRGLGAARAGRGPFLPTRGLARPL